MLESKDEMANPEELQMLMGEQENNYENNQVDVNMLMKDLETFANQDHLNNYMGGMYGQALATL
jgi:hypothetical protein